MDCMCMSKAETHGLYLSRMALWCCAPICGCTRVQTRFFHRAASQLLLEEAHASLAAVGLLLSTPGHSHLRTCKVVLAGRAQNVAEQGKLVWIEGVLQVATCLEDSNLPGTSPSGSCTLPSSSVCPQQATSISRYARVQQEFDCNACLKDKVMDRSAVTDKP